MLNLVNRKWNKNIDQVMIYSADLIQDQSNTLEKSFMSKRNKTSVLSSPNKKVAVSGMAHSASGISKKSSGRKQSKPKVKENKQVQISEAQLTNDPEYEDKCEYFRSKIDLENKRKAIMDRILNEKNKKKFITLSNGKNLIGDLKGK